MMCVSCNRSYATQASFKRHLETEKHAINQRAHAWKEQALKQNQTDTFYPPTKRLKTLASMHTHEFKKSDRSLSLPRLSSCDEPANISLFNIRRRGSVADGEHQVKTTSIRAQTSPNFDPNAWTDGVLWDTPPRSSS